MLSGVGDREQLADHRIDVVTHSPEVGQNLADHLVVPFGFDTPDDSLFAAENPLQLINYLARRRGMLTSNGGEAYGFVRSRADLDLPDLELAFAPAPFFDEGLDFPSYKHHAVAMGPILLKPRSRGSISLRSANPMDKPIIDPQYLTDDAGADRAALMAGLRICAKIAESPAMRDVIGKIARPLGASMLDDTTLEDALNRLAHTPITRSAPAEWAATTPAWWTRSCGCAASTGCGWPTRPSCRRSSAGTPTPPVC